MANIIYKNMPDMNEGRKRVKKPNTIIYDYEPSEKLISKFKGKKVYISTYGCQANIRDEETILGILSTIDMERTLNPNEADIAILNTCAVRENAEDKVYGEIGEFKAIKAKNKELILMLCGCMVEQKHIIEFVLEKYPQVDVIFGTHNIHDLLKILDDLILKHKRYVEVSSKGGDVIEDLPVGRI